MRIGYLLPLTGDGPEVTVKLYDRPPDLREEQMARIESRTADRPQLLGVAVVTLELNPDDSQLPTGRALDLRLKLGVGLDPHELKNFPWRRVMTAAETKYRSSHVTTIDASQRALAATFLADPPARPVGRPRKSDAEYGEIAEQYQKLVQQGVPDPTKRIAEDSYVSRSTAASWVRRARQRGFLPPARPGRAG